VETRTSISTRIVNEKVSKESLLKSFEEKVLLEIKSKPDQTKERVGE